MTKENIRSLKRDHTNSFQSDNVEDIGIFNSSLMIEAGLTKSNKYFTI